MTATAEFADALAAMRPMLLKIARLQLRNDTWAEDAVSETTIAALEGAAHFSGQSQVRTWVVGILKHKIIDHFRKSGREISSDAQQEAGIVKRDPVEEVHQKKMVSIAAHAPRGGAPVTTISSVTSLYQQDAPPCPDCGAIMIRSGACYKCLNCGAVSGCS